MRKEEEGEGGEDLDRKPLPFPSCCPACVGETAQGVWPLLAPFPWVQPVSLHPVPVSGISFQRAHGKSCGRKSPVAVGQPQQQTASCIPKATSPRPWPAQPRATVHVEGRGHLPSGCAAHETEGETSALPIAGRSGEAQVQGKIKPRREGRGCEN